MNCSLRQVRTAEAYEDLVPSAGAGSASVIAQLNGGTGQFGVVSSVIKPEPCEACGGSKIAYEDSEGNGYACKVCKGTGVRK